MFSEISPLVDGTIAKLENLHTQDGEALTDMKKIISIENSEVALNGEKMTYSKTMNSEFETCRSEYIQQMKKNVKDRFRKTGIDVFDDLSKV